MIVLPCSRVAAGGRATFEERALLLCSLLLGPGGNNRAEDLEQQLGWGRCLN